MQKIEAIITPFRLETVMSALADMGVHGFTVTETKGCGHQIGRGAIHRGKEYTNDYLPKLKLEMVVVKEIATTIVKKIMHAAKTGRIGDGKIFVSPVESAIRIRTEERGQMAL